MGNVFALAPFGNPFFTGDAPAGAAPLAILSFAVDPTTGTTETEFFATFSAAGGVLPLNWYVRDQDNNDIHSGSDWNGAQLNEMLTLDTSVTSLRLDVFDSATGEAISDPIGVTVVEPVSGALTSSPESGYANITPFTINITASGGLPLYSWEVYDQDNILMASGSDWNGSETIALTDMYFSDDAPFYLVVTDAMENRFESDLVPVDIVPVPAPTNPSGTYDGIDTTTFTCDPIDGVTVYRVYLAADDLLIADGTLPLLVGDYSGQLCYMTGVDGDGNDGEYSATFTVT